MGTRGFTLIELLIVVAIIGIIAAIAVPNLMNAMDRGKQKRTMADMRAIGTACETYALDHNHYPMVAGGALGTGESGAVSQFLEPGYLRRTPPKDGWGSPFQWSGVTAAGANYTVASYAKGSAPQATPGAGPTNDMTADILLSGGTFIQWPEGRQY